SARKPRRQSENGPQTTALLSEELTHSTLLSSDRSCSLQRACHLEKMPPPLSHPCGQSTWPIFGVSRIPRQSLCHLRHPKLKCGHQVKKPPGGLRRCGLR